MALDDYIFNITIFPASAGQISLAKALKKMLYAGSQVRCQRSKGSLSTSMSLSLI